MWAGFAADAASSTTMKGALSVSRASMTQSPDRIRGGPVNTHERPLTHSVTYWVNTWIHSSSIIFCANFNFFTHLSWMHWQLTNVTCRIVFTIIISVYSLNNQMVIPLTLWPFFWFLWSCNVRPSNSFFNLCLAPTKAPFIPTFIILLYGQEDTLGFLVIPQWCRWG